MNKIHPTHTVKISRFRGGWRARTRWHTSEGPRDVQALGRTRGEANDNLLDKLQALAPKRTLRDVALDWQGRIGTLDFSEQTRRIYRLMLDAHIVDSDLAKQPLAGITPGTVTDYLQRLGVKHGAGAAKTTRTVLSHVWKYALAHGLTDTNPVRLAELSPKAIQRQRGEKKERARAFTPDETVRVMQLLQKDTAALRQKLYGPCLAMKDTGVRISEALTTRWEHLDLDARTYHVHGTKTDGSERIISIPPDLYAHLLQSQGDSGLVWPTSRGTVRDVSNTCRQLREFFARHNLAWATSHTFRKTLATRMDEAGFTAREIADQLGHAKPSMTQDVYMGRGSGPTKLATLTL